MSRYADISLAQDLVAEFHSAAGLPVITYDEDVNTPPVMRDAGLRAKLIKEEAFEAIAAIEDGDLVAASKELCDLIYVCLGAAETFGVDLGPVFNAVHASNMSKAPFERREDGKVVKGPNYVPPDIAAELRAQGWEG